MPLGSGANLPSEPAPTLWDSEIFREDRHRMDKEQQKAAQARESALKNALGQIERAFGQGSIMKMGDEAAAVRVAAIHSVAALTPKAELEGAMGDQTVGVQARMMSQAMRKLAGNLNRANTLCVFTNQIREKVGVLFGSPETQPGGRALKFYASQRLDIRRIETLKEGTEAVGNRVRVKVVKNKVAAPFRQAEFDIEYGAGISSQGCILDLGIEHGIVQKSGSFFSYGDERMGQGRNNVKGYLREHPDMAGEIERKIYETLGVEPAAPALAAVPPAEADAEGEADGAAPEERAA